MAGEKSSARQHLGRRSQFLTMKMMKRQDGHGQTWPDMARHGQTWPDLVVLGSGVGVFRGCGQVEEPLEEPVDDMKTASDALMELTTARVPKEWADFESASFMMCAKVKWT